MRVWRIHLNNGVAPPKTKDDLIQFCFQRQVIGVGWDEITARGDENSVREQAKQAYGSGYLAGFKAVNAMRKMEVGDLIWTYVKERKAYYLCRVKDTWANRVHFPEEHGLDIGNHVSVDWLPIDGIEIPGAAFRSFTYNSSAQEIHGIESISQAYWNRCARRNNQFLDTLYDAERFHEGDIWQVLLPESVEETVLLYLQFEKGLAVLSGSLKQSTPVYECVMVDKDGRRHYPQVKSGHFPLNASDYLSTVQEDPNAHVYLFAASQDYGNGGAVHERIHCLTREEIETFMREYWKSLSEQTGISLDFCHFRHD